MSTQQTQGHYDRLLDARGLNCPLPVLKAKLALNRMATGEILCVQATDPHATVDFHAYCARAGHDIIDTVTTDDVITFYIRRQNAGEG